MGMSVMILMEKVVCWRQLFMNSEIVLLLVQRQLLLIAHLSFPYSQFLIIMAHKVPLLI
jgi:hypothetical protein